MSALGVYTWQRPSGLLGGGLENCTGSVRGVPENPAEARKAAQLLTATRVTWHASDDESGEPRIVRRADGKLVARGAP